MNMTQIKFSLMATTVATLAVPIAAQSSSGTQVWMAQINVSRGIEADNIQTSGRVEREPLVTTADEVAEPRNRRVEILVR
ncbi:MAG: hypothetical protein Q8O38_03400 [Sulfurimicrobium sp.]|nr:hypothetical protein [Sulfurimicrobium sp.]